MLKNFFRISEKIECGQKKISRKWGERTPIHLNVNSKKGCFCFGK
jgi:hypothetical protein